MIFGNPYVLGIAGVLAFGAGWQVNTWRHDAAIKDAMEEVRVEEQIKLDQLRGDLDAANTERLSLAADLAFEKTNVKVTYRTITQEVPTYVPQNTDQCNYDLDPGLVRVLNNAARGAVRDTGSPTDAP